MILHTGTIFTVLTFLNILVVLNSWLALYRESSLASKLWYMNGLFVSICLASLSHSHLAVWDYLPDSEIFMLAALLFSLHVWRLELKLPVMRSLIGIAVLLSIMAALPTDELTASRFSSWGLIAALVLLLLFSFYYALQFARHSTRAKRYQLASLHCLYMFLVVMLLVLVRSGIWDNLVAENSLPASLLLIALIIIMIFASFSFISMRILTLLSRSAVIAASVAKEEENTRLAADRERLDRHRALSFFSNSVAQEVMPSLTSMLNQGKELQRMVLDLPKTGPDMQDRLVTTIENTKLVSGKISDLRRLLQNTGQEIKCIVFAKLLDEVMQLLDDELENQNILLEVSNQSPDAEVLADYPLLFQVMVHIFLNAIDAIADSSHSENRRINVNITTHDTMLELVVIDSSEGFSSESLQQATEMFYTSRVNKLGIGLAISTQILQKLGGLLALDNHPQAGAVVSVKIPICA